MTLPNILVISLGGTITMSAGENGVVPTLGASDLVAAVPELTETALIDAVSFTRLPGAHIGFTEIHNLARYIRQRVRDVEGCVIIQGTDTIEETSFALDMLLDPGLPVVVTGAMRNPTVPGADGPANLLSSVRAAAAPKMHGAGVVVLMNDEIHSARYVQKAHSTNPGAFSSAPFGPIGCLTEDVVTIYALPASLPRWGTIVEGTSWPNVAILGSGIGDDGRLLRMIPRAGCDGVVLEAPGGGHVSPGAADAIAEVSENIPVVVATRPRRGSTLKKTYGFVGSEIDLRSRGAIFAGSVSGVKARVALSLFLAGKLCRDKMAAWFDAVS